VLWPSKVASARSGYLKCRRRQSGGQCDCGGRKVGLSIRFNGLREGKERTFRSRKVNCLGDRKRRRRGHGIEILF